MPTLVRRRVIASSEDPGSAVTYTRLAVANPPRSLLGLIRRRRVAGAWKAEMLDRNNHRGGFGAAYVQVLAAAAGMTVYSDSIDRDGIDLGIRIPSPGRGFARSIEVQVKTTASPHWRDGELVFDGLNGKQFNRLAGVDFQVARYLFVVVVPKDIEHYADLFTSGLLLRTIAYFYSLRERDPVDDEEARRSVRVTVPAANVLTARSLHELVVRDPVVRT